MMPLEYCSNGQRNGLKHYVSIHIYRIWSVRLGIEANAGIA